MCKHLLLCLALLSGVARAIEDSPAVNLNGMLKELQGLQDQSGTQIKAARQRAAQEASAAAGNPGRAVELWESAVLATQFRGLAKESTAFKEWLQHDGDALKEREVQYALHLYFNWLSITMQRAGGAELKTLLPAVMTQAKEAAADREMMAAFEESLRSEREDARGGGKKASNHDKEKLRDTEAVKKLHDQIASRPLAGSTYCEWQHLSEIVSDIAPAKKNGKGNARSDSDTPWEGVPANYDGLYTNIIQPELRAERDPRVLEYVDFRMKKESDAVARSKTAFEVDKFNQVRRPQFLWQRDQELVAIGLKNRAATEMLGLIKGNPNHPDVRNWISELQNLLAPKPPAGAPDAGATATAAEAPAAGAAP